MIAGSAWLSTSTCSADPVTVFAISYTCTHMQGATDVKKVAEENSFLEPYVIIVGSPDHYSQAFLIVDSRLIGEIKEIELVPLVLLASYDVFNICYPKGLGAFYSILEVIVLNLPLTKTSPSVQHVYASILNN